MIKKILISSCFFTSLLFSMEHNQIIPNKINKDEIEKLKKELFKLSNVKNNKLDTLLKKEKKILENQKKIINNKDFFYKNALKYYKNKKYKKALVYFETDNKLRDSFYISDIYFNKGIKLTSKERALIELHKSAEKLNNPLSQFILGEVMLNGGFEGFKQDGVKWIKKSANNGNVEAMARIGEIYLYGYYGVEQNIEEALEWFKLAKKFGNNNVYELLALSQFYLNKNNKMLNDSFNNFVLNERLTHSKFSQYMIGLMLYNGIGIDKDYKNGIKWLKKSYLNGCEYSYDILFNEGIVD